MPQHPTHEPLGKGIVPGEPLGGYVTCVPSSAIGKPLWGGRWEATCGYFSLHQKVDHTGAAFDHVTGHQVLLAGIPKGNIGDGIPDLVVTLVKFWQGVLSGRRTGASSMTGVRRGGRVLHRLSQLRLSLRHDVAG